MSLNNMMMDDVEKIDLLTVIVDFLKILRRMWFKVFVLAVLGATIYGAYSHYTYQAYYKTSVTFSVNIQQEQQDGSGTSTSYIDDITAEQMVTAFPYILTSSALSQKVEDDLGAGKMATDIQARAVENTNLIVITVGHADPEIAYNTLQSVIRNYPAVSELIVGKVAMKVLDETGMPTSPANPKHMKRDVAKGALAGAVIGICWVLFVAFSRKTICREEDCIRYIRQKCLGSVPFVHFKQRSKKVSRSLNITDSSISKEFREAIRIVRNKVTRSAKENGLKVILVTSALPGEGKSTVAVNLAISMAREGKHVALVDGDFRNPSDGEILGVSAKKGLVDYLKRSIELEDAIYPVELEGLDETAKLLYVAGGTPVSDGSKLLSSDRMAQVIANLSEEMDYVLIDSAPVGLLTDASILAQYADGVIFVVKKDFAKADYIIRGIEHLSENSIHMIGCVLNGN